MTKGFHRQWTWYYNWALQLIFQLSMILQLSLTTQHCGPGVWPGTLFPATGSLWARGYTNQLSKIPRAWTLHKGTLSTCRKCVMRVRNKPCSVLNCIQQVSRVPTDVTVGTHHLWYNYYIFIYSSYLTGEGNGNPLQYSCLENPSGGGAW